MSTIRDLEIYYVKIKARLSVSNSFPVIPTLDLHDQMTQRDIMTK